MAGQGPIKHGTPPSWLIPPITKTHVAIYKLTSGRLGANLLGRPTLLLRTMGRRSGKAHTVALPFLEDADSMVVVASNAGAARSPAWYHNLSAAPEVIVRNRSQVFWARHETIAGAERDELWTKLIAVEPAYAEYTQKTTREIPVIKLTYSRPYTG